MPAKKTLKAAPKVQPPELIESIMCETSGKLLARYSDKGMYLYCKQCCAEHLVPHSAIQRVPPVSGLPPVTPLSSSVVPLPH